MIFGFIQSWMNNEASLVAFFRVDVIFSFWFIHEISVKNKKEAKIQKGRKDKYRVSKWR